jgi:cytochrome c556
VWIRTGFATRATALAGGLVVAGVLVAGADRCFAHEGAKGMVNERMNAMKSLKADMKAISDMLRGRVVFKADEVQWWADRIRAHGRDFARLCPEDSNKAPSEASPRIWSEWLRFLRRSQDMTAAAGALMKAANREAAARMAFGELAQACRSCHDDYRLDKK